MLYLVGTPIGNLKDVTVRATEVLGQVDIIACEDTRHSAPFLNGLGIHKQLISYHKYNEREQSPKLIEMLRQGKNIALISDAGMPCISDPGSILVREARQQGLEICVVPGPNAAISALCLCGIEGPFTFIGFLAEKKKDAEAQLAPLVHSPYPIVFYCGCHDLEKYRSFLYERLGDRKLWVVKEITKLFEGVEETTLAQGINGDPRGEFVLITDGATETNAALRLSPKEHLVAYLAMGMTKKEAIKKVAEERGVRRDEIYKLAIDADEKE